MTDDRSRDVQICVRLSTDLLASIRDMQASIASRGVRVSLSETVRALILSGLSNSKGAQ